MKVAVIGFGVAGLFALDKLAYVKQGKVNVHVFDIGPDFSGRHICPKIPNPKMPLLPLFEECPPQACNYCPPAMSGGNSNDGKLILTASATIGGNLWHLIGQTELQRRLDYVSAMFFRHTQGEVQMYRPSLDDIAWINGQAARAGMVYHHQDIAHFGSDRLPDINSSILAEIARRGGENFEFHWNSKVHSVSRLGSKFVVKYGKFRGSDAKGDEHEAVFDVVIIAVGRRGTKWLCEQEFFNDLDVAPGMFDMGVRVETHQQVTAPLNKFYEAKISLYSKRADITLRNFCPNPGGFLVLENHSDQGYALVNGHSEHVRKSANTNFAIMASGPVESPFEKTPHLYSQGLARKVNELAGTKPFRALLQTFGDLKRGRKTESLANPIQPTLEGTLGDLNKGFPPRIICGMIDYLEALNVICPGVADEETWIAAPEIKSYPGKIAVDQDMQATTIPNLYLGGDCSSQTRGIGQSACTGSIIGEAVAQQC